MRTVTVAVAFVVALAAGNAASPAQAATKDLGKIMCLGDSITEGHNVAGGYCSPLHTLLTNGGHTLNNDISKNHDVANAPPRLRALIASIYSNVPNAAIYLASTTPTTKAVGKNISFVDMYNALMPSDLSSDGVPPTVDGYTKSANTWCSAVSTTATPEPKALVLFFTGMFAAIGMLCGSERTSGRLVRS